MQQAGTVVGGYKGANPQFPNTFAFKLMAVAEGDGLVQCAVFWSDVSAGKEGEASQCHS